MNFYLKLKLMSFTKKRKTLNEVDSPIEIDI